MLDRALSEDEQRFGSFFLSRLLGFEVAYTENTCTVAFDVIPTLLNPQGSLHGGVLATAMDISMGHLLRRTAGAGATLEMKVQYLAAVKSGTVRCEGSSLKQGRKLAFLQSYARDAGGELIAHATATWKLLSQKR